MRNHPLTRAYVEPPVNKVGLGMLRIDLSYCKLFSLHPADTKRVLQKKDT